MNNLDSSQGLSDVDRYDIIIDSLIKIKEEMDKSENSTVSTICKQAISEILKDSSSRGNELLEVKNRIETLVQTTDDLDKKESLESINGRITRFNQRYNARKQFQERQGVM